MAGVCTNIFCVMWDLGGWVVGVCTNIFCVMWNLGGWVVGVINFWPEDQMPTSVLRFQDTHTRIGFHLLVCDILLIYWPKAMRDFAITWCWLSYVHLLLRNHWSRYSNLSQIWAESSLWYLLSELCQMITRIIQHVWCYYK